MGYALVGTIGAVSQGASGAAVTPAWGASESRTAGNLLLLWVDGQGSATLPAAPAGWAIAQQKAGTSCSSSLFFKVAAGGETAPTVAAVTSTVLSAQLGEFSGNQGTPIQYVGNVGSTTNASGGSSATITIGASGVAQNNRIIISALVGNGTATPSVPTDSRSNTYALDKSTSVNTDSMWVWSANVGTALQSGDTITVNLPSGNTEYFVDVESYSGVATATYSDGSNAGTSAGSNSPSSGNITTTTVDDLIFGCIGAFTDGGAITWTNPIQQRKVLNIGSSPTADSLFVGDNLVTPTGSYAISGTVTNTPEVLAIAVAYKPASVPGSAAPLDQVASAAGTTSPRTATAAGADAAAGELIGYATGAFYSAAATKTLSNSLNNGATANNTTNNSTSTANHYDFGYGITTGNSAADSDSFSFTTNRITGAAAVLASFKIGTQTKLQAVTVTTTTSPAIIKQTGKLFAVTSTTVPALLKQVGKVLSVTSTTSPVLAAGKVVVQVLAVTTTTAVALIKQAQKLLSVTSTTSPAIVRQIQKVLAISTTTVPAVLKQVGKILAVTTTTTPSILTAKLKIVLLAVTTTTTVTLTKLIGKIVSVSATTSPALVKQIGKVLKVTSTTTAALVAVKAKFITLAVTTTTVPAMVRQIGKKLTASSSPSVTLVKQIGKRLSVTSTTAPQILAGLVHVVTLSVTTTTSAVISTLKTLAGLVAQVIQSSGGGAPPSKRGRPFPYMSAQQRDQINPIRVTKVPDWLIDAFLRGDIDEEEFTVLLALN